MKFKLRGECTEFLFNSSEFRVLILFFLPSGAVVVSAFRGCGGAATTSLLAVCARAWTHAC